MSYPYFRRGLPGQTGSSAGIIRAEDIPTLSRLEDPGDYLPHPNLSHAVNVSLMLGMPLLLTGEPGTGKTQLSYTLANDLGCAIHRFDTKSTSTARDLFYTYDAMSAFKQKDDSHHINFIHYEALGRAILDSFQPDNPLIARLLPPPGRSDYVHQGPRRSVVLIDEIDKAPRDFPNDLLNEIERLFFRVPELNNWGSPGADSNTTAVPDKYRPIIVMTSNSEKGLPDPFLRRCVYFDIPFPSPDTMRDIVSARMKSSGVSSRLIEDAIDLFYRLRHDHPERPVHLKKQPSTAELINWLQVLSARPDCEDRALKDQRFLVQETLPTLVKNADDQETAARYVVDRWGRESA